MREYNQKLYKNKIPKAEGIVKTNYKSISLIVRLKKSYYIKVCF